MPEDDQDEISGLLQSERSRPSPEHLDRMMLEVLSKEPECDMDVVRTFDLIVQRFSLARPASEELITAGLRYLTKHKGPAEIKDLVTPPPSPPARTLFERLGDDDLTS